MSKDILLGHHLLLQLTGCDLKTMEDKVKVRKALLTCAQLSNSTVVAETFHSFSPHGLTGVVVIQESHISIHTWPEHKSVVIDLFTCNLESDLSEVAEYLKKFFKAESAISEIIDRSIPVKNTGKLIRQIR